MTSTAGPMPELLRSGQLTGTWVLAASDSSVTLKTKAMFGVVPVKGTFGRVSGQGTISPDGEVRAEIVADAASLSTKMKKRDAHLQSADFFDVANYPAMTVRITGVDADLTATGTLTVKERSIPLSFPVTLVESGTRKLTLDASFTVDRSRLGLDFSKMGATKMLNAVTVHAVFTRS